MIAGNACGNDSAPTRLTEVEKDRAYRTTAYAVRCPRPGCKGQLYLEADLGGHVFDVTCLLCSHTQGEIAAVDLVTRYGMSWRDVERAAWQVVPLLWYREDAS